MKKIAFISTIILFFGFKDSSIPVYINGHIKKNPSEASANTNHLRVFVKGDKKILAESQTDDDGNFKMTFTPLLEKSFDFYCSGIGVDTMLLASLTSFENDTPEITFYLPCNSKKNSAGKTICPKCKRTDKVYPIEYGNEPVTTVRISKSGDTTYSHIYKGTYQESCVSQPAKYYCDRDKVKF